MRDEDQKKKEGIATGLRRFQLRAVQRNRGKKKPEHSRVADDGGARVGEKP